jgi:hypothetical protein
LATKKSGSEPDDLITYRDAARLRGYSPESGVSAVSRLVTRGRLASYEKFGRKLVSRAEVLAFKPLPAGRKPGKAGGAKKAAGK